MRGDTDFNGARPLIHHLVDTDLEHLVRAQRPAAQDHAVIEVIGRTAKTALSFTTPTTSECFFYIHEQIKQSLFLK